MRTYYLIQRHSIYSGSVWQDVVQSSRPQEWQLNQCDRVFSLRAGSIAEARQAVSSGTATLRRQPGL